MPMTVEIDEEEIATRIAGAELRLGEILWHLVAEHVADEKCARVIDWARSAVARETAAPAPRPLRHCPAHPPRAKTGLPLFDAGDAVA